MLALSTSWKSKESNDGEILLQTLEGFDIYGVELEYRINDAMFRQMRAPLKRSRLKVVSIHNFFPIPPDMPHSHGGGDLFLLSHPDNEERQRAVQYTIKSIEHANDLEATAVVLHCGYVDMNPEIDKLYQYLETNQIHSEEAQAFINQKLTDFKKQKSKHVDSLLFSLDSLVRMAEKQNVLLGLENRYHYYELPHLDDFEIFFSEFKGGSIGYWHDTGHAHVNETLTISQHEDLLKTYYDSLIGIHLHDAMGLEDHLAPGTGEIDFERIKSYIKDDTLLVIELKPGTPDSEVSQSIRFLHEKGIS